MKIDIALWSINVWFRFTGFRVFVQLDLDDPTEPTTRLGIMWWGNPFDMGEGGVIDFNSDR